MRYAASAVLGVVLFWALVLLGMSTADAVWTRDCDRLGAHVVEGKVYECRPR